MQLVRNFLGIVKRPSDVHFVVVVVVMLLYLLLINVIACECIVCVSHCVMLTLNFFYNADPERSCTTAILP